MKEIIEKYLQRIDLMKVIVGLTIMGIFSLLVNALITKEMPEGNREIVVHVLGIIEGAVMAIVGFYYGSSKGSQQKDELLAKKSEQQ
jgi:uncharacterized protein YacL